jgi:hypothetical protein
MPAPTVAVDPEKNLALLKLVGETVFGAYWQKSMGVYLGMSQRQLVRWSNGQKEVPDVMQDGRSLVVVLRDLLDLHLAGVHRVIAVVDGAIPPGGRPGT